MEQRRRFGRNKRDSAVSQSMFRTVQRMKVRFHRGQFPDEAADKIVMHRYAVVFPRVILIERLPAVEFIQYPE